MVTAFRYSEPVNQFNPDNPPVATTNIWSNPQYKIAQCRVNLDPANTEDCWFLQGMILDINN